jgi:glycosyltransferase involved in cell wall biosynthesis
MNELISVIVPIYNTEGFLAKCIKSITEQTYLEIEIILVNDGSQDNCGMICDQLALDDDRIRVIHKDNSGISDARNAGLDSAAGKYVLFADSDDYLHPEMIEKLWKLAKRYRSDLVICNYTNKYNSNNQAAENKEDYIKELTNIEALNHLFSRLDQKMIVAWNKLYYIDLFSDIRYPSGRNYEDEFVSYRLLDKAKKIVYTGEKLYFHVWRENSIMGKGFSLERLQVLDAHAERTEYFLAQGYSSLYKRSRHTYMTGIIKNYYRICNHSSGGALARRKLFKRYRAEFKKYKYFTAMRLRKNLILYLFYLHPGIYRAGIGVRKKFSCATRALKSYAGLNRLFTKPKKS